MNPKNPEGRRFSPFPAVSACRLRLGPTGRPDPAPSPSRRELRQMHHPLVLRLARRRGLPVDEALGLVQEVFLRVAQTLSEAGPAGPRSSFRRWFGWVSQRRTGAGAAPPPPDRGVQHKVAT